MRIQYSHFVKSSHGGWTHPRYCIEVKTFVDSRRFMYPEVIKNRTEAIIVNVQYVLIDRALTAPCSIISWLYPSEWSPSRGHEASGNDKTNHTGNRFQPQNSILNYNCGERVTRLEARMHKCCCHQFSHLHHELQRAFVSRSLLPLRQT